MNKFLGIYTYLKLIKESPKTTEKVSHLKFMLHTSAKDTLEKIIKYCYDSSMMYNLVDVKVENHDELNINFWEDDFFTNLDILHERKLTGHAALNHTKEYLETLPKYAQDIFIKILNKDLAIGMNVKLINKAFGHEFIKTFDVMLCDSLNDKTTKHLEFPVIVQEKYDAARCIVMIENGGVKFFTRNGKEIHIENSNLHQEFLEYARKYNESVIFDGEIYAGTLEKSSRKTSNGIINSCLHDKATYEEKNSIKIVLWDILNVEEFYDKKSEIPYIERLIKLKLSFTEPSFIEISTSTFCDSMEDVTKIYNEIISKGGEGVIIKNAHAPYEGKRSKNCLKVKQKLDCTLEVVGYEYGKGKYSEKLGAIVCESQCKTLKVSVGSGFNDSDRNTLIEIIESHKQNGTRLFVDIEYNEVITSRSKETKSLFLPVFKCLRFDKTEAEFF